MRGARRLVHDVDESGRRAGDEPPAGVVEVDRLERTSLREDRENQITGPRIPDGESAIRQAAKEPSAVWRDAVKSDPANAVLAATIKRFQP